VCVIKLIGWKMDGWIGLSGCGKWMESGCGKWKVARFRISQKNRAEPLNCEITAKIKLQDQNYEVDLGIVTAIPMSSDKSKTKILS